MVGRIASRQRYPCALIRVGIRVVERRRNHERRAHELPRAIGLIQHRVRFAALEFAGRRGAYEILIPQSAVGRGIHIEHAFGVGGVEQPRHLARAELVGGFCDGPIVFRTICGGRCGGAVVAVGHGKIVGSRASYYAVNIVCGGACYRAHAVAVGNQERAGNVFLN